MRIVNHVKNSLLIIISFYANIGLSQRKLRDFSIDTINRRDNNGRQGTWFLYYSLDSTIYSMEHFKNDTLNGYYERYWNNGKVSEKGVYLRGKVDSTNTGYWENGFKRMEEYYNNGLLNGIATTFDSSGNLTSRYKYSNGVIDSSYKESYIDPKLIPDNLSKKHLSNSGLIKTDTLFYNYPYISRSKEYVVYINDTLNKDIIYYNGVANIESFYEKGLLKKRIVYYHKKPFNVERIFYFRGDTLIKTELYNKEGMLTKIISQQPINR
jgi:antitoxin component YwqK of YwqJK toxin-antitoxin module